MFGACLGALQPWCYSGSLSVSFPPPAPPVGSLSPYVCSIRETISQGLRHLTGLKCFIFFWHSSGFPTHHSFISLEFTGLRDSIIYYVFPKLRYCVWCAMASIGGQRITVESLLPSIMSSVDRSSGYRASTSTTMYFWKLKLNNPEFAHFLKPLQARCFCPHQKPHKV